MKKHLLLILALVSTLGLSAQHPPYGNGPHGNGPHGNPGNHGPHGNPGPGPFGNPGWPGGPQFGPMPMDPVSFDQAMGAVSRQTFESSKLEVAQQILRSNLLTSNQVLAMARLFTFESGRLEFAELAYGRCVDPQNYWAVNDAFTFSSTVSDLNDYIMAHPAPVCNVGPMPGQGGGGHGYAYNHGPNASDPGPVTFYNGNGCSNNYGYNSYGCSPADFDRILESIRNKSFDSSRLTVAKQVASGRRLSSMQVRRVLDLFTFESTRVDFAKFAYRYVCDPQNYFIVNDAFTFESSIRELNSFIRSC